MKTILLATTALAALTGGVQAQVRYDEKLEKAAMERVASRIGDLRPALTGDALPAAVRAIAGASVDMADQPAWHIATDSESLHSVSSGSIQSFSDGKPLTSEERRELSRKSVSRVIKF